MGKDNLIFIHKLIKAIADAIIIVFIPLYILKSTDDIRLAMLYLISFSLFVILFMFILKKNNSKIWSYMHNATFYSYNNNRRIIIISTN